MSEPKPSPYDRIGGEAGIEKLVGEFYERVLADPALAPFFHHGSMDRLRAMQKEFFSEALGGPLFFSGRSLRDVHAGRRISKEHLRLFVQHLMATVAALELDRTEIDALHARVALEADEITGGATSTG